LDSVQDFNSLLIRLKKVPIQLDQITELLKQGIEEEITHHNASMFRVRKQFEVILNSPVEKTDFYKQFQKMPETLGISQDSPEVIGIQEEAKVCTFDNVQCLLSYKYNLFIWQLKH
jgi:uncharacterized protein (DUF885 family)